MCCCCCVRLADVSAMAGLEYENDARHTAYSIELYGIRRIAAHGTAVYEYCTLYQYSCTNTAAADW